MQYSIVSIILISRDAIAPPEIFRVNYKIGSFLHKAGLGYSATIRQSLYLTSHVGGIKSLKKTLRLFSTVESLLVGS